MRPLGLILAAVLAAPAVRAQAPTAPTAPPGTPTVPMAPGGAAGAPPAAQPAPQPAPPQVGAPNPRLDVHLAGWEAQMRGLVNFRADFTVTKKDAVFQKARDYGGSVLCAKPNFARLRLENVADKRDYEAFICNGQFLYAYSGLEQSITEFKLPPGAGAGASDNLMLDFLSGMTAKAAKERFQITLHNEDANYVYLDIKPLSPKDRQEFEYARFALFGPNVPKPNVPYLPVAVSLVKPNGDSELWRFTNPQTNLPGVDQKVFEFQPVPGFPVKKAPPPGQPMPGGQGLPAGSGAVRPNRP
jgi:TIGR03009 family protein